MQSTTKTVQGSVRAHRFAEIALDVGTYLLASGAHSGRVKGNINRLAEAWGLEIDMNQSFKGLLVSVSEKGDKHAKLSSYRSSPPHNIHFAVLDEVSDLTWDIAENKQTMDYFENQFAAIKRKSHYNAGLIALAVGCSCAGLTLIAKGDFINALFAFMGASVGSIFRYFIAKKGFNPVAAIGLAAFTTTLITGLGAIFLCGSQPETAMAIAVLYLIPGVPLVNCIIDLIDGYLSSAVNRAVFAGFIILAIAAGMTLCIALLGINNFS